MDLNITNTPGSRDRASEITTLVDGSYVVTWNITFGESIGAYYQVYGPDGSLAKGTTLLSFPFVDAVALSSGGFAIVGQSSNKNSSLTYQTFGTNGEVTGSLSTITPSSIPSQIVEPSTDPEMLSGGKFAMVTSASSSAPSLGTIQGAVSLQSNNPDGSLIASNEFISTSAASSSFVVGFDSNAAEDMLVVWTDFGANEVQRFQVFSSTGATKGGVSTLPNDISTLVLDDATGDRSGVAGSRYAFTLLDNGNVFTVIRKVDAKLIATTIPPADLYVQIYSPTGSKVGSEIALKAPDTNANDIPVITQLNNGTYVVAWIERLTDPTFDNDSTLWVRTFDANGAPIGAAENITKTSAYAINDISAFGADGYVITGEIVTPGNFADLIKFTKGDGIPTTPGVPDGAKSFTTTLADEAFTGGDAIDTLLINITRADATLTKQGEGFQLSGTSIGTDTLQNVERLIFTDGTLALDVAAGENAGSAYRIYQAAFARTPDNGGLTFWIDQIDTGAQLVNVASGFIASAEFKSVYGENPSNTDLVAKLYQNVLGRDGEEGGITFWTGELNNAARSVAEVLAGFSESPENVQSVGQAIGNGFLFGDNVA